jgi:hypothetical protein
MAAKKTTAKTESGDSSAPATPAANLMVVIDGVEVPWAVELYEVGCEVERHDIKGGAPFGGFKSFGSCDGFIRFLIGDDRTLSNIASDRNQMLQTHTVAVHMLYADKTPVTSVTLTGVQFKKITVEKSTAHGGMPTQTVHISGGTTGF